jgi:hypothetical protein
MSVRNRYLRLAEQELKMPSGEKAAIRRLIIGPGIL